MKWVLQEAPSREGKPPVAGLKLLHCRQNRITLISLHPALTAMNELFSLPQIYRHLRKKIGFLGQVSGPEENLVSPFSYSTSVLDRLTAVVVFILKRAQNTALISAVVTFNPAKNITAGYILSGVGQYSIKEALPEFPLQFSYYPHPLLILILILELIALKISVNLEELHQKLSLVEKETVFSHRFTPTGTSNGKAFHDLAKTLGAQTCRFAVI